MAEFTQTWKCDAFLSFRGEDTRNNFVAHLYKRLEDWGINTFKDDMKLERGKFISLKLLEAIEESRTAIIIFSKNYASSTWCLEELTKIMERADKKGQEAIPVFYNIEPSDVRMHRNSFAKVLAKHEADLKGTDLEKVQRWKDTLNKEANIAGWDVRKTANGWVVDSRNPWVWVNFCETCSSLPIMLSELSNVAYFPPFFWNKQAFWDII